MVFDPGWPPSHRAAASRWSPARSAPTLSSERSGGLFRREAEIAQARERRFPRAGVQRPAWAGNSFWNELRRTRGRSKRYGPAPTTRDDTAAMLSRVRQNGMMPGPISF
jgi:hypothetical protein